MHLYYLGKLAYKLYETMKRNAAAVRVQRNTLRFQARKAYTTLRISILVIQSGLRSMDARNKFRVRRQTKAATVIQVKGSRT